MFQRAIILLQLITAICILGLSVPPVNAAEAGPVLLIPLPHHDAGTRWEGESVTHSFEIRNEGNAELKILKVKPG